MGKNNFTNWTTGCGNGCADDVAVCPDCGCETVNPCANHDCGCNAKPCANNDCGCCAQPCGCNHGNGCSCNQNSGCGAPAGNSGCGANSCGWGQQDGTHIYYETCDGFKEICVTGVCQQDAAPGRVLDVNATLTNVCPGRRSALGFALTEVDENGAEYARGFQAITVPAHNGSCNQDVQCDTVRFILPEDQSLQSRRHFIVRTQHHYLDAASIWNNGWGGCGR